MGKRHLTEKEVARVLRRATEIQSGEGKGSDGVSTDELRKIGLDVGIDSKFMDLALSELDAEEVDRGQSRWLGAPPSYEIERFVDGVLSDEAWQGIVSELNSDFHQGIPGSVSPPVRMWHHKHDMGSLTFTATQGPTSVRLKMSVYLDDGLALGMVFAILAMVMAFAPVFAMDELVLWARFLFPVVLWPTIWLAFTRYVKAWYARDRRKMDILMSKLEGIMDQKELSFIAPQIPAGHHQHIDQI